MGLLKERVRQQEQGKGLDGDYSRLIKGSDRGIAVQRNFTHQSESPQRHIVSPRVRYETLGSLEVDSRVPTLWTSMSLELQSELMFE